MDAKLLQQLSVITAEEQEILAGRGDIDRSIYMQGQGRTINSRKLLASGKLITIRPHTRFIHFPEHTHDYVEVVYMCAGQTVHIVNGKQIRLEQGDLLGVARRLYNVFEDVLEPRKKAEIDSIKAAMIDCGALGASMSGSGPTVFGLFDDEKSAQEAVTRLGELYKNVYLTETV